MNIDAERNIQSETPAGESNVESVENKGKPQSKTPRQTYSANQIIEEIGRISMNVPKIKKDTESDVPKAFDVPVQTSDLVEHAIELWRLEQRLNKVVASFEESQKSLFTNSIQKLKRYLEKNGIEIVEHTNQKFNHGRNLDVILVEKSPDVTETIIKETKEPTVLWKNQVVHKGKVIILEGSGGE